MGPHKKEKLNRLCSVVTWKASGHSYLIYLLMLKRLPIVNNAANFLDFTTTTGVNARACSSLEKLIALLVTYPRTRPKHMRPSARHVKNPMILSLLLWKQS